MVFEVTIDMGNTNALVTVAMLASLYQNEQKDYLDIITPFVCNLLPARTQPISFAVLQQKMETEFGFHKMPIGVLKKIVLKLCNQTSPICAQRNFDEFFVVRAIDNTEFRNRRRTIKETCSEVACALQSYLDVERSTKLDAAKCTLEILRFLDRCGHQILRDYEPIKSLPIDEKMGRYIASFIQLEQKAHSTIYDKFLDLARGYMVYRCVYFLSQSSQASSTVSLDGVIIYLDTPLIIDLLNFDTDEGNRAVTDVISLAQSLGAQVRVLDHCVEEVQGILYAYIARYPNVQQFRLRNLTLKGHSSLALSAIITNVPKDVEGILGCKADVAPGLGTSSDWDRINTEEALSRYYDDSVREQKLKAKGSYDASGSLESVIGDKRVSNDVQTLSFALQLRNGDRPLQLNKSKVIVLSNSKMARRAVRYLYEDFDWQNEINLVYSLIDFSCMTWLAAPVKTSDMAEDMLLYNAAAILDASDQVITLMLKYVDELADLGNIDEEMAFLLRTHPSVREAVAEVTGNNEEIFERNMILPIYHKVVESKAKDIAADQYRPQITELQTSLDKERQKDTMRRKKLDEIAQGKSECVVKWVKRILKAARWIITISAIGYCGFLLISRESQAILKWSLDEVLILVVGLLGLLDSLIPRFKIIEKPINRFANWCGDKVYSREIRKGQAYLEP